MRSRPIHLLFTNSHLDKKLPTDVSIYVVLRPASESTCARFCVFDRVSHQYVSSPWEERSNTK